MKRNFKIFLRALSLSAVIVGCLLFALFGSIAAFENTSRIGFGEYKNAFEITSEGVRIFDFMLKL